MIALVSVISMLDVLLVDIANKYGELDELAGAGGAPAYVFECPERLAQSSAL